MNSSSGKKISTGLIALLVTVFFMPAIAGAFAHGDGKQVKRFHREDHHRSALGIWRDPQMIEKLGLTEVQVKQVRDEDFSFREKSLALKAQLDGLRLQMDKAFYDDVIEDAVILKTAQKMSEVKGKLFVQEIEARLTLGKILNADQIKKLKLYAHASERERPRLGKKRIFRPRSMEIPDAGTLCDDSKE
jgi:Spy/CpxP family protein refolding chaperone